MPEVPRVSLKLHRSRPHEVSKTSQVEATFPIGDVAPRPNEPYLLLHRLTNARCLRVESILMLAVRPTPLLSYDPRYKLAMSADYQRHTGPGVSVVASCNRVDKRRH